MTHPDPDWQPLPGMVKLQCSKCHKPFACREPKLQRTVASWANLDPWNAACANTQPQISLLLTQAQTDILTLAAEIDRLNRVACPVCVGTRRKSSRRPAGGVR